MRTLDFKGKVVAVTGASVGFGHAISTAFAACGARVFATALHVDALKGLQGIEADALDLMDRAAGAGWIRSIEARSGQALDVLVNNAGGMLGQTHKPVDEVTDAEWDSIFAVNLPPLSRWSVRRPPL